MMLFQIVAHSDSGRPLIRPRSNRSSLMDGQLSGWFAARPYAHACRSVLREPSGIGLISTGGLLESPAPGVVAIRLAMDVRGAPSSDTVGSIGVCDST